jgi:5-methylcytosine-specific restriction protein B
MSLYFPEALIPVHAKGELLLFMRELGQEVSEDEGRKTVTLSRRLTEVLTKMPELRGWSNDELMRLLYAWREPFMVKIAPGPDAKFWKTDCLPQGMICVGWDEVGDLKQFPDFGTFRAAFEGEFLETYNRNQSKVSKKAGELWWLRDLKPGDLIAANRGVEEILAIGEVVAPGYVWDGARAEFQHTVRVAWDTERSGKIEPIKRWALNTVEVVTGKLLQTLLKLSRSSPVPTTPAQPPPKSPEPDVIVEPAVNRIYYGAPGTGKTYRAVPDAVRLVEGGASISDEVAWSRHTALTQSGRIRFVTFHPSYSYEDFVEGIRPVLLGATGGAPFECRDGLFKQMSVDALFSSLERTPGAPAESAVANYAARSRAVQRYLAESEKSGWRLIPVSRRPAYVMVIDEINRANISKVLGELITLLEPDKRHGADHGLTVTLPYSGERFAVPSNLHLLGTMNTADKSIALLDVALRRRFAFVEVSPDFMCCDSLPGDLRQCLDAINHRIELRKDREHRIGHAYFMDVTDDADFDDVFRTKVVPLLQEYFFHDMDGARFVLGDSHRDDAAGFLRPLAVPAGAEREARNRWRWFTDSADAGAFKCALRLRENFASRQA